MKIHFRRCHICGTTNTSDNQLVQHCDDCGKNLTPFYFFNERRAMGLPYSKADNGPLPRLPYEEYPPVWGLTAYWDL